MAQLLDSGNLVLVQEDNKSVIWQSFDYPTNTLLPFMKFGLDRRTGLNRFLTCWKSKDDPGTGNSSLRIDPIGFPQLFLYMGQTPTWRAGPWNGLRLSGVPEMTQNFIFNISFVNNQDEIFIMYGIINPGIFSRMVVNESGAVERYTWRGGRWFQFWHAPKEPCDKYLECGPNSYCDPSNADKFECTCLPGFEPKSSQDWYLRDGSGGCVRKQGVSTCNSGEGFVKLARVKVPNTSVARANMSMSWKECEQECLRNCSCTAYTSANVSMGGIGCLTWHGNLVDTRTYTNDGQDLYLRVDADVLAQYAKKNGLLRNKGIRAAIGVSVAVVLLIAGFIVYRLIMRKKKEKRQSMYNYSVTMTSPYNEDSPSRRELDGTGRNSDLPLFELSTIVAATDNFSIANKLGEGGFGSVYKGLLHNGMEIAIKRLSKSSGQGIEQFKNEVALIAKLQHRNLVRILGCCIQGEEKMLIYEYLPNKSLDYFIFDETKRSLLDWGKRYFGMAKIFGGDQIEANTNCVVGTYGYMSPEYAMQGLFSIKSDVFSFGVLLLEIITGKKNSTYYHDDPSSNLIGHVWDLWKEDKAMELIDSSLGPDRLWKKDRLIFTIRISKPWLQMAFFGRVERTLPRLLKPSSVPSKIIAKRMKVERRKWKSRGLICGFGGFLSAHMTVGR
nr:g-type lectin s-receptor-like serine/threonine-protein kinase [Quercus suber]